MGQGGDVFVLDMGTPIHITDLARQMIHLSGFNIKDASQPHGDIEIIYTGLRPGEKLYEELLIGNNVSQTQHEKIMRAEEAVIDWDELKLLLTVLEKKVTLNDFEGARSLLKQVVTGFNPQCAIVDEVSLGLQRLKENKESDHANR